MRLKCSIAIAAFWPIVNGAGGNTSSAEAPPAVAILARRAASRRAVGPDAVDQRRLVADLAAGDVEHALLLVEGAGRHFGRMRVDGDGGQPFGRRHVAQVLAEVRLVDRQVVMERQDDGRDDAMRDVGFVTGHSRSPSGGGRLHGPRPDRAIMPENPLGRKRHDPNLRRCCICAGARLSGARRRAVRPRTSRREPKSSTSTR